MTKKHFEIITIILVVILLFSVDPVYAGPGGTVVKALFKTWWGKLLMILLAIILLPLIIYSRIIEFIKVRQTKKELLKIGLNNNEFSWLNMEKNISNIFTRTYLAWSNEDMSEVKNYVNHWYWQNQQLVILDRWKKENIKNICSLERIKNIKPLYIEISDQQNQEGSKIVVQITASIEDYLIERNTKKIVKGNQGYIDESHIWILEFTEGKWLLDNIVTADYSLAYLKTANVIPKGVTV